MAAQIRRDLYAEVTSRILAELVIEQRLSPFRSRVSKASVNQP
jgi:hypothetical protein